jgi:hypothetical protein
MQPSSRCNTELSAVLLNGSPAPYQTVFMPGMFGGLSDSPDCSHEEEETQEHIEDCEAYRHLRQGRDVEINFMDVEMERKTRN